MNDKQLQELFSGFQRGPTIGRKRRRRRARGRKIEARQKAVFRRLWMEAWLAHRWGLINLLPDNHLGKHGLPKHTHAFEGVKSLPPSPHVVEAYVWTPAKIDNLTCWHSADYPLVQDGRVVGLQDLSGYGQHLLLDSGEDHAQVHAFCRFLDGR